MRSFAFATSLLMLLACSHTVSAPHRHAEPALDRAPPPKLKQPTVSIAELNHLFGVADVSSDHDLSSESSIRDYVRFATSQDSFFGVLTGTLYKTLQIGRGTNVVHRLRTGKLPDGETFFYRERQCDPKDLERTAPWWAPTTQVSVCRQDHMPSKLYSDNGEFSCDVFPTGVVREAGCGCGPGLLLCAPDELRGQLKAAVGEEIRDTLKYIVTSNKPYGDIFAMNESVRSGLGDYFYARNRFFQSGEFVKPNFEEGSMLRARDSYFGGGILTSPAALYSTSRRETVARLWEDVLCVPLYSTSVGAEELLAALRGEPALRAKDHLSLSKTPGCENCHARLEYASRAFMGWESQYTGLHFQKSSVEEGADTRFYVRDHHDLRSEGPATPLWLGSQIVGQPEFAECVVDKIANLVYEGHEVPGKIRRSLLKGFEGEQNLLKLIEDSTIARVLGGQQ